MKRRLQIRLVKGAVRVSRNLLEPIRDFRITRLQAVNLYYSLCIHYYTTLHATVLVEKIT